MGPKCRRAALGQDQVLCALLVFKANLQLLHLSNGHLVRERWWWAPNWGLHLGLVAQSLDREDL